jgi:hypothetical protein
MVTTLLMMMVVNEVVDDDVDVGGEGMAGPAVAYQFKGMRWWRP